MTRSIFGCTVPALVGYLVREGARLGAPLDVLPRRRSAFAARAHGVDVRRGDLLALTVPAWSKGRRSDHDAGVLMVAGVRGVAVPTHPEPYDALAGRVVAVATLAGCYKRSESRWASPSLRKALGDFSGGEWWWLIDPVIALPRPVECAADVGLWSLPVHVTVNVMSQVRAAEAARHGA